MSQWVPLQQIRTPQQQSNAGFLQSRQHELLALVQSAPTSEPLEYQKQGRAIRCRVAVEPPQWIIGERDAAEEERAIRDRVKQQAPESGLLVMIGGAAGYGAAAAAALVMQRPNVRVVVVEPTPARILSALTLVDLAAALATERLHFVASAIDPASVLDALKPYQLYEHETPVVMISPELHGRISADDLLASWPTKCSEIISEIGEQTKRIQRDASPATVKTVMLANCWQGAPGELHLQSIERYLSEWGIKTHWFILNRYRMDAAAHEFRRYAERHFLDALEKAAPDLIISYGYHAPQMIARERFESLNIPWAQAVSNIAYHDYEQFDNELCVPIEKGLLPIFEKRGYRRQLFQPIMADFVADSPTPTNNSMPVVMVGNSLALSPEARRHFWQPLEGRPELKKYIEEAERELGDFDRQIDFYAWLTDSPPPRIEHAHEWYAVFRYLLSQATAARRRTVLEALAPLGLTLFGGDWDAYLPADSPLRGCLKGYLPISEEPKAFQAGSVFVNIHSVGHQTGPNMRFFNVAGMGGFQISDRPGFDEYLASDSEALYADSVQAFVELTRQALADEAKRNDIRASALERVRRDWTYRNWLESVFEELNLKRPAWT